MREICNVQNSLDGHESVGVIVFVMNISSVKALGPWFAEGKHVWIAIGINVAALIIALRPGTSEPVIRITGMFLQIFGIGTVIWGIRETRVLFGHPSGWEKFRSLLKGFPLLRRDAVAIVSSGSMTFSVGNVRAYGISGSGLNPTTETRLDALEKNITEIHERISATQREIDEQSQKARESLESEGRSRQAGDAEMREKLEATGTGGLHISAMGASWLFFGVVLSTIAPEIAARLK
jgi:hypothetical protein